MTALIGVHMNVSINTLTVTVNDGFTRESAVHLKRSVHPRAISVDS